MAAAPVLATAVKYATLASGVLSSVAAVKQLTTKAPKAPSSIESTTPTGMPTEDSQLVADAKRRALVSQTTRGGRASTVLTDTDSQTFGGT